MIQGLFRYDEDGEVHILERLEATAEGLEGDRPRHGWRQVLLLDQVSLNRFGLQSTDLRENILLGDDLDLHALPSGTVLRLGSAGIRLTFHCEPCRKIKHLVSPNKLLHRRGYLGQVVLPGEMKVGDAVYVSKTHMPAIPYAPGDRIKQYLDTQPQPVTAAALVEAVALPKSYCRALPNLLKRRPDIDAGKIVYASARRRPL